jgi:hypothetical protein
LILNVKTDRSAHSKQFEPIGAGNDLAKEKEKDAKENETASNPHTSASKTKIALHPIVERAKQKELQQTLQTTLPIITIHSVLLKRKGRKMEWIVSVFRPWSSVRF